MTPERWKKIEDIFQAALDREPNERDAFLHAQCGGDNELSSEIQKLIAHYETEEKFLESPVWSDSQLLGNTFKNKVAQSLEEEVDESYSEKSFAGRKIGVYLLTAQIGKGGMGIVYAAERSDGEFSQKVAVKLIKRGMDTDFIVKRFRQERQILANLNHPNIARLLDGGTTEDGLPYFVMEFIKGVPIFQFCEENGLNLRQKLKLFLLVCNAVFYAHQQKIIHRDIKASNILVTDEGIPKLLDFGIAKILDTDSIHESLLPTATAMRLMTPEYASPEQVRGEEITPASDQYSLGVLLYELITGNRPYKFSSRTPQEIARIICEELPGDLSGSEFSQIINENSGLDWNGDICQKLDRIIQKALRKAPGERYQLLEELTADIERFLRNESSEADFSANKSIGKITSQNQPANDIQQSERTISPRRKGVKQGIFLMILSFLLVPFFVIFTLTGISPPQLSVFFLLLFFFGGLIRIVYALLFEEKEETRVLPESVKNKMGEAETKLIATIAPPSNVIENKKWINSEKTRQTEKTIAVLPFKNLNSIAGEETGESGFLSVGLADALITRLSNIRQLIVRPTSSVLRFGMAETDSFQAGTELNVSFIVEGNIIKTDKKIRVSIQLLNVREKSIIWAKRYDDNLTDVLDIEDSISAKVVESLIPRLTGEERKQLEKRGTDNAEAHEAYLRGRYYFNFYTDEGFQKAIQFYKKAVELAPEYALAYAAIADYYVWISVYDVNPVNPKSKEFALKAISLDKELSEAYAALGLAILYSEYDWKKSEENLLRAIDLNPNNSVAHLWYSHNLYTQKRFAEGLREVKLALKFDPLSYLNHNTYAWSFYFQRRYVEALELTDVLIDNYPNISQAYFSRGCFLNKIGKTDEAMKAMEKAVALSPDSLFIQYGVAQVLAAAGKRREVEKLMERIKTQSKKRYFSNYQAAIVYCYLNDLEKAFAYLEKSLFNHDSLLIWIEVEPSLDLIRNDERYLSLLTKIKHPNS